MTPAVLDQEASNSAQAMFLPEQMPTAIVRSVEDFPLPSDFASQPDPETHFCGSDDLIVNSPVIAVPDFPEWSPQLERRFVRLAEDKALGKLSLKAKIEFEKLSEIRRQLKNPRTGEEIIAEYEQRRATRNLVKALTQYVEFHKPSNQPRKAA